MLILFDCLTNNLIEHLSCLAELKMVNIVRLSSCWQIRERNCEFSRLVLPQRDNTRLIWLTILIQTKRTGHETTRSSVFNRFDFVKADYVVNNVFRWFCYDASNPCMIHWRFSFSLNRLFAKNNDCFQTKNSWWL